MGAAIQQDGAAASSPTAAKRLSVVAGLLAAAGAIGLWWLPGQGDAATPVTQASPAVDSVASGAASASAAAPPSLGPEAAAMVAKLEARLKEQPDDREGWAMLARAYAVMEREADAVAVYRRLLALSPPDPVSQAQAHADLGRAIGRANGRKLNPEADEHLRKALELNPKNVMAHALLGRVALERGDAAAAKQHWEQAQDGVDSNHPFAKQLRQSIDLATAMLAAGKPAVAGSAPRS